MSNLVINGATVYTEAGPLNKASITIQNGKISAINEFGQSDSILEYPSTYHVIPGMIDMHIHGAAGADIMDATPEALATISAALVKEGTTGFLATTMTETRDRIAMALSNIKNHASAVKGAAILGVHLEGPFLAPKKMGAQCGEHITSPEFQIFQEWQQLSGNTIRLVTVAPELDGALPFIREVVNSKVLVSLGHSDASFAEACAGVEAGGHYATHLFNAMRGIHQREPGIAVAMLLDDRVTAELVLDGNHLHPAMVELAWQMKGQHRLVLVTDAMRAKCLGEGTFDLGGQSVQVKNGLATLNNGTIAGSVLKLNDALKNFLRQTGISLVEALPLVCANPAKLLGLYQQKGSLAVGKDADIVVLNEQYEVVTTICQGQVVYSQ